MEVALVVNDLSRSEKFYRELFGFDRVGEFTTAINSAVALSRDGSVLKLIQYQESPDQHNPPGRAYGLRFLTLEVPDLEHAVTRCREFGATIDGVPARFQPVNSTPRQSGEDVSCWYVFVLDPDGNRIEVRAGSPWAH
ncbi:VOC family protein [Amycolatopsis pithecellobii]|nr:VOC family protein [Amycolatopsis pithecellobii]